MAASSTACTCAWSACRGLEERERRSGSESTPRAPPPPMAPESTEPATTLEELLPPAKTPSRGTGVAFGYARLCTPPPALAPLADADTDEPSGTRALPACDAP